jgi:phage terminase large subunit
MWLATGNFRKGFDLASGTIRIVRKYQTTIKSSVQVDFEEVLDSMELWDNIEHNKVDKTYTLVDGKNKRTVVFSGADDQQKLRGMKQDILYCNEANELSGDQEFFQLLMRTKYFTIIDFNPDDEDVWINTQLEKTRARDKGDVEVIVSTYKDNPMLPKQMVEEIEYLENTDPAYWQIYGLGEYGKIRGLVFPEWGESPAVRQEAKFLGYGMDFGYTNDPTAIVAVYRHGDGLIFDEILFQKGMQNSQIAAVIQNMEVNAL